VLADAPMREPGESADRVRRGVEDHLAPLGPAGVGDRLRGQAGTGAGLGEALDLLLRRRARLEGAERRVAPHLPADVSGLDEPPGRERRPADDALGVAGDRLLVADAVLDGGDAASV